MQHSEDGRGDRPGRGVGRLAARALAVVVGTPAGLVTALRAAGADLAFPWPAVATVFPWVVLLDLVALALAALGRWRTGTIATALAAATGVTLLAPRALPGPSSGEGASGPALRVAVANLRVGGADAGAVVDAVRDHDVDVLVTLELTDAAIDRLDGAGLRDVLPDTTLLPSRMTSGGGIHSRLPLVALDGSDARGFGRTPRAEVTVPGLGPVTIDAVHPLPPIDRGWTERWRAGLQALGTPAGGGRRILAGDFNATLDHAPFRALLADGWIDAADAVGAGLRPTFNALPWGEPVPPVTLDHVLVDADTAVERVDVVPLPGSDHRLLVVALRLPAG